MKVFKLTSYLPLACYPTVFDINYQALYHEGRRVILIDLDNTLLSYDHFHPDQKLLDFFNHLKELQFFVIIISNNSKKRVLPFAEAVGCPFVASAKKPLKCGYRRALRRFSIKKTDVICIGDQIMTDVLGASRMGFDCLLVKPLKAKSEKWFTKFNRKMERMIAKKLLKKYPNALEVNGPCE